MIAEKVNLLLYELEQLIPPSDNSHHLIFSRLVLLINNGKQQTFFLENQDFSNPKETALLIKQMLDQNVT